MTALCADPRPLGVLLVDDHPVVREGLRGMLDNDPGIAVVGEAGSGEEALRLAGDLLPDVVLMDIRMPDMNGIEATRALKATHPALVVVVLTMYDSEMYVVEALRAGAAGFLVKDCSRQLLCHTVRAAADGGTTVRSGLLRQAIQARSSAAGNVAHAPTPEAGRFTTREMDVLGLVAQGCTNRQIARTLNLAEVTVKKHVQSIIGKLGASDRTQAAIAAVRLGLVM